jgi:hypothetical protein
MPGLFACIHEELGGGSWLIGRVTGSEYAKGAGLAQPHGSDLSARTWFARRGAKAYSIALDTRARLLWGRSDIGGDPIVVVLTARV